jgi:hypothetical protein
MAMVSTSLSFFSTSMLSMSMVATTSSNFFVWRWVHPKMAGANRGRADVSSRRDRDLQSPTTTPTRTMTMDIVVCSSGGRR